MNGQEFDKAFDGRKTRTRKVRVVNVEIENDYAARSFRTAVIVTLSNGRKIDRYTDQQKFLYRDGRAWYKGETGNLDDQGAFAALAREVAVGDMIEVTEYYS